MAFSTLAQAPNAVQFSAPVSETDKGEKIARIFEIFFVKPEMRTPYDKVIVTGSQARISLWRDLPKDPQADKVECTGYQFLLSGRGQHIGRGAATVFEKFPEIQTIQLDLVEVGAKSKRVDGKGKLESERFAKPYLRMVAERTAVQNAKLQPEATKRALWKDTASCLKIGRATITRREIQL